MARHQPRAIVPRQPVGLRLSIGDVKGTNRPGRPIDHFRAKPGEQGEHLAAAEKFHAHYGEQPKTLNDVYLLSNEVTDVLDVRVKWWTRLGMGGCSLHNLAALSPEEFAARCDAWQEEIMAFLPDRPDPVMDRLKGPEDPRIAKYEMHVEATIKFLLPEVLGIGTVVEITSKGRRSRGNLYAGVTAAHQFLGGNLIGPRFRLTIRPASNRYWQPAKDDKPGKWSKSEFHELVFDTALTVAEIREEIAAHRMAQIEAPRPAAAIEAPASVLPDGFAADMGERPTEEAVSDLPVVQVRFVDEQGADVDDERVEGEVVHPPSPEPEQSAFQIPESVRTRGAR